MALEHAGHVELAAAGLRAAAVGRHVHDDLELHVIIEVAVFQSHGAKQVQEIAHARIADKDPAQQTQRRPIYKN